MSYFFDATGELDGTLGSTYASTPVTMACWVYTTDHVTTTGDLMNWGVNAPGLDENSHRVELTPTNATPQDPFQAVTRDGTGDSTDCIYLAADGAYDNTWLPVVAVFSGAADRTIYVGAFANSDAGTLSRTVEGSLGYLRVGDRLDSNRQFSGYIAEVALWRKTLSQAEIESFIAGNAASGIGASDLVAYFPLKTDLNKSEGIDSITSLSNVGATQHGSHPPILSLSSAGRMLLLGVG